jgi:hypothetical protein
MKCFFDYLFYKYYWFQQKVGNGDLAPFMSMLIIAFTLMLYYFSFTFIIIFFIPNLEINMEHFKNISIFLFFLLIFLCYLKFLYNENFKKILKNDMFKNKSNLNAILFPLIAFLLFNLGWILKMFQNQGKI